MRPGVRLLRLQLRRLRVVALAAALAVSAACAPRPGIDVGVQDYNSDILFGAKAAPPPLPPAPPAVAAPTFPGFIQPPIIIRDVLVSTPPPEPPPPPPRCKKPDLNAVVDPPAPAIVTAPAVGQYTYRAQGTARVGATTVPLPEVQPRLLSVLSHDERSTVYAIEVIGAGGAVTTTTYSVLRSVEDPTLDGLYIRRVVMEKAGEEPQVFEPADLGLRIFAQPAADGVSWTSVATDPLRLKSMRLAGAIESVQRLNICGTTIEGWESKVAIDIVGMDAAGNRTESKIEAVYVVAPQLGGLILEDTVVQTGVDAGQEVELRSKAVLEDLKPRLVG